MLTVDLRASVVGMSVCLVLLASGCSQLDRLQRYASDDSMLEYIAERTPKGGKAEGIGTIRIEYEGGHVELPFAMEMGRNGLLEVEADVGPGFLPGFGRMAIISDEKDTAVYSEGRRMQPAPYDSLGPALRPILLSLFGGGDMLLRWLVLKGCRPGRRSVCGGLRVGFTIDRNRGSVGRWTVRDPVRGVSFNGFVETWDSSGNGVWVVGGMLHPYEVGISVRYARLGPAAGPDVAFGEEEPGNAQAGNAEPGGVKPGNFMKPLRLE